MKWHAAILILGLVPMQQNRRPPDRTAEELLGPATAGSTLNQSVARVGKRVITALDLQNEWELGLRLRVGESGKPNKAELEEITKAIVRDFLWIDQARTYELYAQVVTAEDITKRARGDQPKLWEEEIPDAWRTILRRWAEASISQEALLHTDPKFQRSLEIRPDELRRFYREHRDDFVELEQVLLSRVVLGTAVMSDAEELAGRIRENAVSGGGLESAADQFARGSYEALEWEVVEKLGLRPEILDFARDAELGAISAVFAGRSAFSIYELLDRREARTVPFSEAAAKIRRNLRIQRFRELTLRYFILKLLPQADFEPVQLFDSELGIRTPTPGQPPRKR